MIVDLSVNPVHSTIIVGVEVYSEIEPCRYPLLLCFSPARILHLVIDVNSLSSAGGDTYPKSLKRGSSSAIM